MTRPGSNRGMIRISAQSKLATELDRCCARPGPGLYGSVANQRRHAARMPRSGGREIVAHFRKRCLTKTGLERRERTAPPILLFSIIHLRPTCCGLNIFAQAESWLLRRSSPPICFQKTRPFFACAGALHLPLGRRLPEAESIRRRMFSFADCRGAVAESWNCLNNHTAEPRAYRPQDRKLAGRRSSARYAAGGNASRY